MESKKIAVLFGGCSPEHDVSLQSAYAVLSHMDRTRFEPVMIGITREGNWLHFADDLSMLSDNTWQNAADCAPVAVSPNRADHALLRFTGGCVEKITVDGALPILHGQNGEDGTVQGLLQLAGIPVIGCGVLASALCMDKYRAHQMARTVGVAVPESFVLEADIDYGTAHSMAESLGYPLFVKPVKAGSSFGITRVTSPAELPGAIDAAREFDQEVILEENIPGFEVGCAVMGNKELTVGEVDEVELSEGFFNYTEKYSLVTSSIHVPARIDSIIAQRVKSAARKVYRALGCRGFARVDFFLTPEGKILFNEVNTIPGFTAHSRFPSMMKAAGISFEEVITDIIEWGVGA